MSDRRGEIGCWIRDGAGVVVFMRARGRVHGGRQITHLPRRIRVTHGRAFQINDRAPSLSGARPSEPMAQARSLVSFVAARIASSLAFGVPGLFCTRNKE